MNLPKNFCIAPFVQLTTHPTASFSPCPYLGGTVWKEQSRNLLEQWRNKGLEQLRQDFLDNKQSSICNRCWNEERNNKRSLRQRFLDPNTLTSDMVVVNDKGFKESVFESIQNKTYLNGPRVLSIKNGNLCNAKCRVCHPGDSSRWSEDSRKLLELTGKQFYTLEQNTTNWSEDQLEQICELGTNLVRLELFGGEPTYNKSVIRLLNKLVNSGDSKHIVLYINTNGSVDIVDRMPAIKEFRKIEIGVSFDGYDEKFNYIRHGAEFEQAVRNVQRWQQYFKENSVDYWIDSISTVSILNVYYLPELKERVMKLLPLSPFWNLLVNPAYLYIKNMPDNVKKQVIKKLSSDSEFDDVINVINQPADLTAWKDFVTITTSLDSIRKEDFGKTFPEFAGIIGV